MPPPITSNVRQRLVLLFKPEEHVVVEAMLSDQCGNDVPMARDWTALELDRIRLAVLKLSEGDMAKLEYEIREVNVDWRDTLMAADFGHDITAHERWWPDKKA